MVNPDVERLEVQFADDLTYGHTIKNMAVLTGFMDV